jgi:hypothetical protein
VLSRSVKGVDEFSMAAGCVLLSCLNCVCSYIERRRRSNGYFVPTACLCVSQKIIFYLYNANHLVGALLVSGCMVRCSTMCGTGSYSLRNRFLST